MVELIEFNEYSVHIALRDDHDTLFNVLYPAVVGTAGSANSRARKSRRLDACVRKSINEQTNLLLLKDGVVIGGCIFEDRKINVLVHINILEKHRIFTGTGLMLHYITNKIFEDEPVFFSDHDEQFLNVSDKVSENTYKIKDTIATMLYRMFGDING